MKLPLLISVPHAGVDVPQLAAPYCILTLGDIVADSDEGAAEIYTIEDEVEAFITTSVARAIVDLNRAEDDRRKDGVVKTHTCWDVPVYEPFPPDVVIESLLETYYRPYHTRLREVASSNAVRLGVDCHTMLAVGPPVSPDPGVERPWVCLSNADGTCPQEWIESLRRSFEKSLGGNVRINEPFRGGYITRTHATEMPWLQLELSRAPFLPNRAKRDLVLEVFQEFYAALRA